MLTANTPGAERLAAGAIGAGLASGVKTIYSAVPIGWRVEVVHPRARTDPDLGLHPARQRLRGRTGGLLRPHPHRAGARRRDLEDRRDAGRLRPDAAARDRTGPARRLRRDRPRLGVCGAMSSLRRPVALLAAAALLASVRRPRLAGPSPGAGEHRLRSRDRARGRDLRRRRRDHRRRDRRRQPGRRRLQLGHRRRGRSRDLPGHRRAEGDRQLDLLPDHDLGDRRGDLADRAGGRARSRSRPPRSSRARASSRSTRGWRRSPPPLAAAMRAAGDPRGGRPVELGAPRPRLPGQPAARLPRDERRLRRRPAPPGRDRRDVARDRRRDPGTQPPLLPHRDRRPLEGRRCRGRGGRRRRRPVGGGGWQGGGRSRGARSSSPSWSRSSAPSPPSSSGSSC